MLLTEKMWAERLRNVDVAMRDGVLLRADVFLPATRPCSCLLYRTPYNKEGAADEWTVFGALERHGGFAVVVVDVRGRYASQGEEFVPYLKEGSDGYDCVEWCAMQAWCNGQVGTFGISYPGAVQWLTALQQPPHLRCMIPAFTYHDPASFVYFGGVFDGSWREWTLTNIAPDVRVRKNLPGPKTDDEAREDFDREVWW
jgi:putative CocE/NonD family hydrolase